MIIKMHTLWVNPVSLNTSQKEYSFNDRYFLLLVELDGCMLADNNYIRDGHILR